MYSHEEIANRRLHIVEYAIDPMNGALRVL